MVLKAYKTFIFLFNQTYGASEVKIVSEEDGELDEGDDDFSEGWEEDFDDSE